MLFGVAGLCGVLAAAFAYAYMEKRLAEQRETLEQQPVASVDQPDVREIVAARNDVLRGERVAADDLRTLRVPAEGVLLDGVITEPGQAEGRVAVANLYAGEWVSDRKLAAPDDPRQGLGSLLAPEHRAIRIPVDPVSGLLGILEPDDRVDVVGVFASDDRRTVARTLLQNVPVLAVGQQGVPGGGTSDPEEAKREQAARRDGTVTLDVTRKQAEIIALALGVGKVQLALRNTLASSQPPSDGVDTGLLERAAQPAPPPSEPRQVVQVLHGGRVDEQVVNR